MNIIRASHSDTDLFNEKQLAQGACCFYTCDRSRHWFFEISGTAAVVHTRDERFLDDAVREFLFYSGFICRITRQNGGVVLERPPVALECAAIAGIQPSQFYISRRKLEDCMAWLARGGGIYIPVAGLGGKTVALDGHTRLRAALELGRERVQVYREPFDPYIEHFAREAARRGVTSVAHIPILSESEYAEKWHKYCDDFFDAKENENA